MTFEHAWLLVATAGRELGSGPHLAVLRLVPDHDNITDWMVKHRMSDERVGACLLGIAVGLVMAQDPVALQTLRDIEQEWRSGQHG
jgi:hypothetical protein